jgi:AraC-like DNA-binding protein
MKRLVLKYQNKEDFFNSIGKIFNGEDSGNNFYAIDDESMSGNIQFYEVDSNFILLKMDITAKEDLSIARNPSNNPYMAIRFMISEQPIKMKILNNNSFIEETFCRKIFFSTAEFGIDINIRKGQSIKLLALAFERRLIKDILPDKLDKPFLSQIQDKVTPIYRQTDLSTLTYNNILQFFVTINKRKEFTQLYAKSMAYYLLSEAMMQLCYNTHQIVNLNQSDIDTIKKLENILSEEIIENTPVLEELSKRVNMSVSKMNKIFKYVFGKTIYAYHIELKMRKSLELLLSKKYTVSEVANIVGYSSTSKFAATFQKHFNTLPSKVT